LIVSDDDAITQQLKKAFQEAGLVTKCAKTVAAGCKSARSGRFPVVITTPVLADGSWRRLVDIASQYQLGFVVVLVASNFDFTQWAKALEDGAFDVLDSLHELPKAAEVAKRAWRAANLRGAEQPHPEGALPPRAA
jgi:DNA-binding NtrC family response regulator